MKAKRKTQSKCSVKLIKTVTGRYELCLCRSSGERIVLMSMRLLNKSPHEEVLRFDIQHNMYLASHDNVLNDSFILML